MYRVKLIPVIIFFLAAFAARAQQAINYKALVKDNSGNAIVNQSITVQFSILKGVGMTNVYQETHSALTDSNGNIILNIGNGIPDSGVFSDIDWGGDSYHLNVQMDTGSGLSDMGTTQFRVVPYALHAEVATNANGLTKLDEGFGDGWRLLGKNSDNYGAIGYLAVDLTESSSASATKGATGTGSFASGYNTTASGSYSTSMGQNSVASGGTSSAIGSNVVSSGNRSVAIGVNSEASGNDAIAIGNSVRAEAKGGVALGEWNAGGGDPSNTPLTNPILEVGIGTDIQPKNALTILRNGNIGIDTNTPDVKFQVTGGSDVSLTGTDGYIMMGEINGFNLSMDNNEIMARNNGSSTPLYLQGEGGEVVTGGSLNLNDIFPTGVALKVNGDEALWYNGTYFSWGFGGTANYFADKVGIGTASPIGLLDVVGSSELGIRVASNSAFGAAIYAINTASVDGNYAIIAENQSTDGTGIWSVGLDEGVFAQAVNIGVRGDANIGVKGEGSLSNGIGVSGEGATGVYGISQLINNGIGVRGEAWGESGKAIYGEATGIYGKGIHVKVTSTHSSANGILSEWGGGSSYAGYFVGRVHVAGTLSKSSGSFKIDHPLDPENKYLSHSYVESPDMMNVYNGNVTTDEEGKAEVELPDYFEVLNTDFRYQLTVMGQFAQAIISKKISGNTFEIMTDHPNVEVSWQVTGIRNDAYARKNRIPVEEQKEPENMGKYLNPEAFDVDASKAIGRSDRTAENNR